MSGIVTETETRGSHGTEQSMYLVNLISEQMLIHADGGPYTHSDYSYSLIKGQRVYKDLISEKFGRKSTKQFMTS